MTRQIASLTRKAESKPVRSVTVTSRANGRCAWSIASAPSARKAPETFRCATTIIMPSKQRDRVLIDGWIGVLERQRRRKRSSLRRRARRCRCDRGANQGCGRRRAPHRSRRGSRAKPRSWNSSPNAPCFRSDRQGSGTAKVPATGENRTFRGGRSRTAAGQRLVSAQRGQRLRRRGRSGAAGRRAARVVTPRSVRGRPSACRRKKQSGPRRRSAESPSGDARVWLEQARP